MTVIEEITQPVGRTSVDTPEAISAVNVDRVIVEGRCAAIGTGKPRVSLRIVPVVLESVVLESVVLESVPWY